MLADARAKSFDLGNELFPIEILKVAVHPASSISAWSKISAPKSCLKLSTLALFSDGNQRSDDYARERQRGEADVHCASLAAG